MERDAVRGVYVAADLGEGVNMRLSEAMRLGAALRPQGFRNVFAGGKSCAIGAAAEAVGIIDISQDNTYVEGARAPDEWKTLCKAKAICPECLTHADYFDVESCVMHLNDSHIWTRERIADWIESLEMAQESKAVADVQEAMAPFSSL